MSTGKNVSEAPARVLLRRVMPREKASVAPVAQRELHVIQGGPVSVEPIVDAPVSDTNRKATHIFPELAPENPEPETPPGGAALAAYLLTTVICGAGGGVIGLVLFGTIWGMMLAYFAAGLAGFLAMALFLLCRRQGNAPEAGRNRMP